MKLSPLEFAREFEKLKSDLARLPSSDLKLLRLVRFWTQLAPVAGNSTYKSYTDDFRSTLIGLAQMDALSDLSLDSLGQIRSVLDDLIDLSGLDAAPTKLQAAATAVTLRMVTLLFYVGEQTEAVSLCAKISDIGEPDLPDPDELLGMSPLDRLREICKKVRPDNETLFNLLEPILVSWEENRSAVNHDRVYCLFIDKDGPDSTTMGRMRLLKGEVEQTVGKTKTSTSKDHVAFNNQIKIPDDPFIGVVYESLKAVRLGLRSAGFARRAEGAYRAFLSIERSDRTFTGDSIGLAAALLSFTQLLKPEVMRHDRFIASDIAVTGSINADGEITSVNDSTIAAKIERAFFSHVRYVVVPEANAATARDTLTRLQEQYPHRNLRLLPVSHLNDVLDDRNIIRAEKVCPLDYIVRQTVRYSRATKVQIPLLLILIYAATCLIYPKAWVGFDWNPEYVQLTQRGFVALNKDSMPVWDIEYECERIKADSKWDIGDLDGDGTNEVAFLPRIPHSSNCDVEATLFVFRNDGEVLFERPSSIRDTCLSRVAENESPFSLCARFLKLENEFVIVTKTGYYRPGSEHVKIWDGSGNLLTSYVNSGFSGPRLAARDIPGYPREVVFLSMNNPMGCVSLYSLVVDSCDGVSPPYADSECEVGEASMHCQSCYMLFPRTELNRVIGDNYNRVFELASSANGTYLAHVNECGIDTGYLSYYIDQDLRVYRVEPDDNFKTRRTTLVDEGKLPAIPWPEYLKQRLVSVIYWTDSGWVTEGQLRTAEEFSE